MKNFKLLFVAIAALSFAVVSCGPSEEEANNAANDLLNSLEEAVENVEVETVVEEEVVAEEVVAEGEVVAEEATEEVTEEVAAEEVTE